MAEPAVELDFIDPISQTPHEGASGLYPAFHQMSWKLPTLAVSVT
jgi:hypothetical protein